MRAPRGARSEFERRSTTPSIGESFTYIPADGEAELGHGLHACGTGASAFGLVACFEGGGVDALGEVEELLEVG